MANIERFNAALLHVYGYNEDQRPNRENKHPVPVRPDIRGRLVISAARELKKAGLVDNFVLSGEGISGKPPASLVAADETIRKTHTDSTHVCANPQAPFTTSGELKTLRKTADDNSWQNLLSISWELHKPRIQALAKKIFRKKGEIVFLSAEHVLLSYSTPRNTARYKQVIDSVHNTQEEQNWQAYEKKLLKIIRIPFASDVLDFVARFYRPNAQK
ncbi:MAG: hypothetical protein Q8P80_00955 [Candidatus Levybacteria bacterium]|nr:hypothetical protein [Candidatus Levybacteria bacterium]